MEFTFSLAHISILAGSVIALIVASFFALSVVRRKMASSVNAGQKNKIDTIKYEFVTVITHKFRTPLTQIKWGAEGLRAAATETQKEIEFRKIERAADTIIAMIVSAARSIFRNSISFCVSVAAARNPSAPHFICVSGVLNLWVMTVTNSYLIVSILFFCPAFTDDAIFLLTTLNAKKLATISAMTDPANIDI